MAYEILTAAIDSFVLIILGVFLEVLLLKVHSKRVLCFGRKQEECLLSLIENFVFQLI